MSDHNKEIKYTLRIETKRSMVAIMSVLMVLILVTTIGFGAFLNVFAANEDDKEDSGSKKKKQTESVKEDKKESEDSSKEKSGNSEESEKKSSEKDNKEKDSSKESKDKSDKPDKEKDKDKEKEKQEPVKPWTIDDVSSSSYIVMSGSTSEVVMEKHPERKMYPGRITMLMTAMVVIDNMYNDEELSNTVDIGQKLASMGQTFREGESVTVGDLLYTMLMSGDVQSAEALARYSASSRKIFIKEMNSKAVALGLMDTHFTDPAGEYSTRQYSTAKDCAMITQAAFRYPLIRDALAKDENSFIVFRKKARRVVSVRSSDPMKMTANKSDLYKYSAGGIAGYTGSPVNAAQYSCVSVKDGMQVIVVLMDSDITMLAKEASALLKYGDDHVTRNVIVREGRAEGYAKIKGGEYTRVPAYTETKGYAYVPPEGSEALVQTEVVMQSGLTAPVKKGTKVGEFRIYVADELKGTVDLVIKKEIKKGWPPSQIYISNRAVIIAGALVLLLLLAKIRIRQINKKRARRREAMRQRRIRELAREQLVVDEDRRKRNWTFDSGNYDKLPPRTSDIRKEAIDAALREENAIKAELSGSRADRKRAKLNRRIKEKNRRKDKKD